MTSCKSTGRCPDVPDGRSSRGRPPRSRSLGTSPLGHLILNARVFFRRRVADPPPLLVVPDLDQVVDAHDPGGRGDARVLPLVGRQDDSSLGVELALPGGAEHHAGEPPLLRRRGGAEPQALLLCPLRRRIDLQAALRSLGNHGAARQLLAERIAPGILPKVLGRFDMIAIFVAIVLFAVQGSVVQPAGASAFVYWILGFVTFLIPGAIVTGQLGLMFPGEGSIYVWTNKALGSFWGFFAGFCAWWPGTLVMVATAVLVVNLLQFFLTLPPFNVVNPLGALWQQGIIILAVIWFSSALSILRFRVTQNLLHGVFVIYGAAIPTVGLAGLAWLLGGHSAANDVSTKAIFGLNSGNATFYGLVILALLGIEVPLNMGVEIKERKAITSYLIWGSVVVMAAYLLLTFGAMVVVPQKDANSTYAILQAVQSSLGAGVAAVVTLIMIAFFIFNTTVYNYSFARLLFVSGLDRRLPAA